MRGSPGTVQSEHLVTCVQDDVHEVGYSQSFVSPPRQRRRITAQLRKAVVQAYESGKTSRHVAEDLELGRTTVLKILKTAGVEVRPPPTLSSGLINPSVNLSITLC